MPAPLVKGIIITLSLLTALGAAALANPQVRAWIEEQRRKIAEALHSLGDEFDPQTRRQAEAFAFEGRIPHQQPEAARRESEGARNAVARATGRESEIDLDETSRRLARVNSGSLVTRSQTLGEEEEAERRRMGREYLARRNAEMLEAKEKAVLRRSQASLSASDTELTGPQPKDEKTNDASAESSRSTIVPPASTDNHSTFDALVDYSGSLKSFDTPAEASHGLSTLPTDTPLQYDNEKILDLPSPPTNEPKSFGKRSVANVEEPEIAVPAQASGFDAGSRWANPFGDEFELEDTGYTTSYARAPAVPPKIALDQDPEISVPDMNLFNRARDGKSASIIKPPSASPVRETRVKQSEELLQPIASFAPHSPSRTRSQANRESRQSTSRQQLETMPGNFNDSDSDLDEARFEDKFVQALLLRTAEEEHRRKEALAQRQQDEERDIAAAIAASLADEEKRTAKADMTERIQGKIDAAARKRDEKLAQAKTRIEQKHTEMSDVLANMFGVPPPVPHQQKPQSTKSSPQFDSEDDFDSLYDVSPEYTGGRGAQSSFAPLQPRVQDSDDGYDDLYSASPEHAARQPVRPVEPLSAPPLDSRPGQYDPVHEAATVNTSSQTSASVSSPPAANTTGPLIDISEAALPTWYEQITEPETRAAHTVPQQMLEHRHRMEQTVSGGSIKQEIDGVITRPRPRTPTSIIQVVNVNDDLGRNGEEEGAQTPTTATLSPQYERDSIGFSTDDEDEYASAAGSMVHSSRDNNTSASSNQVRKRRASTVSFTTDVAHNDFSETDSLENQSEAETASLVGGSEASDGREGVESVEDDSSDEEWASGVRTPGSEWTDVGSQVSEDEIGGQDERRLVRE